MKNMKFVLVVILVAVFLLSASGCGGKTPTDPNAGVYAATKAEMLGIEVPVEDFWDNGFEIELKDNGKCQIRIDGKSASGKWSLENGAFSFKGGGVECSGTLENGTMWLENILDSGVNLTLMRELPPTAAVNEEGSETPTVSAQTPPSPVAEPTVETAPVSQAAAVTADAAPLQAQWNGTWYGLLYVYERSGAYTAIPEESSDVYMRVDIGADGLGTLQVYLGDMLFATVSCEAHDYGLDATAGELADGTPITLRNWTFRSVPDYPEKITISDEIIGEGGEIEFTIFVKQWGQSWQADIDSNFQLLPPSVQEYEAAIANGAQPPIG